LTADDPSVASLAEHRRRGGAAVFLRGQTAVVAQGEAEVAQIALGPLMGDNCRATAAVLQAIAAGWAAGLAAGQIAAGLAAFAAAHEATCPRGPQP
jgi:cyanophycin synthetase